MSAVARGCVIFLLGLNFRFWNLKETMRKIVLFVCLLMSFASPAVIAAQGPPTAPQLLNKIPQNILDGLEALRRDQFDQAELSWKKGSLANLDGIGASLRNNKESLGDYHGFDLISLQDISLHIRVIYIALNYERGPEIRKFVSYRNSTGWVALEPITSVSTSDMASVLTARPTN